MVWFIMYDFIYDEVFTFLILKTQSFNVCLHLLFNELAPFNFIL